MEKYIIDNLITTVNFDGDEYRIYKSPHSNDKRFNLRRDHYIADEEYQNIFKSAALNGISQFRNRGSISLSFRTLGAAFVTILCELKYEEIHIVTILYSNKHDIHNRFTGVRNRLFLKEYILPDLTNEYIVDKHMGNIIDSLTLTIPDASVIKSHRKGLKIKTKKHPKKTIKVKPKDDAYLFLESMKDKNVHPINNPK